MGEIEKINLDKVDWRSSREFFESLGEALEKLDDKDESYNFTWVGKRKSIIEAGAPINKTFRPDLEASKDFDNTKNMLIVGDNLDALKLLQESYLGKIKMIYIDPPYNTGHDFVYHDNFTVKKGDYADATKNEDGDIIISEDKFEENSKANGRFHSDWLSMMYPRLKLARNLLSDDGLIFISIDENEQANLKKVCDEILGEDNFVAVLIWQDKYTTTNDKAGISSQTDFCLCYCRNNESIQINKLPLRKDYVEKTYTMDDNDGRGSYQTVQMFKKKNPISYEVTSPTGKKWNMPWNFTPENFKILDEEGKVFWGKDGNSAPRKKVYLKDSGGVNPVNLLLGKDVGFTGDGGNEIEGLFGNRNIFSYPKPTSFVKHLAKIALNKDSLILDFFAGSGTTGHAVMSLNAADGGNRQYICVQLDEKTAENSEAKKLGYETIDQITAERLRRAGDRLAEEIKIAAPLERAQKETGIAVAYATDETKAYGEAEAAKLDIGFRVFRIDSGNEKESIRKPLSESSQMDMFDMVDNIKEERTPLDLLFGVIYAVALPFDLKLETRKIGDNTVYLYGYLDEGAGLAACFDEDISEETVKEIAKLKPLTATFKDSSFTDSAAKINLSEHFRIISPDTKVKVI